MPPQTECPNCNAVIDTVIVNANENSSSRDLFRLVESSGHRTFDFDSNISRDSADDYEIYSIECPKCEKEIGHSYSGLRKLANQVKPMLKRRVV